MRNQRAKGTKLTTCTTGTLFAHFGNEVFLQPKRLCMKVLTRRGLLEKKEQPDEGEFGDKSLRKRP